MTFFRLPDYLKFPHKQLEIISGRGSLRQQKQAKASMAGNTSLPVRQLKGLLKKIGLISLFFLAIFLIREYGKTKNTYIIYGSPSPSPSPSGQKLQQEYIGKASFYNNEYCRKHNKECLTASGDIFNENAFTCACSDDFNLGSRLLVSYKGRSVEVVCNDRGSFKEKYGRLIDLSEAAFKALAATEAGVIRVNIKEVY